MPGPQFAVIDFETGGLFPGAHDRIIRLHGEHQFVPVGNQQVVVQPKVLLSSGARSHNRLVHALDVITVGEIDTLFRTPIEDPGKFNHTTGRPRQTIEG